jgi:hypothetical protein
MFIDIKLCIYYNESIIDTLSSSLLRVVGYICDSFEIIFLFIIRENIFREQRIGGDSVSW